jgi:putative MATE family efflux protein
MRDLTRGPVTPQLLGMAGFIGVGLIVQTLYFLVDLYFVSRLGDAAVAGVSSAGIAWMVVMAATQAVGVGALSLIAQAIGRTDPEDSQRVFDQTLALSLAGAAATLLLGATAGVAAVTALAADAETAEAARAYLLAFLPSLALLFPGTALASALRAAGVVGAPMIIQSLSLVLNAVLAPVLIVGWGTGIPLGVAGAGWASSIAVAVGLIATVALFRRLQTVVVLDWRRFRPDFGQWRRIVSVGAPSAGEFLLMFVIATVIYWALRDHGAEAQAGFGVGMRVMQAIFLPAMAVAFAAAPIAGQNFGAGLADRVRKTFNRAAQIGIGLMAGLSVLAHVSPATLVRPFATDPQVAAVAATYLQYVSWNFAAAGLVFVCSSLFQALGDTRPALYSSASRLLTFAVPVVWLTLTGRPELETLWTLSVASTFAQALISFLLLRREFRKKLTDLAPVASRVGP